MLLLPQFSGPPRVRIAHGALTGAACLVLTGGLTERTFGTARHPRHCVSLITSEVALSPPSSDIRLIDYPRSGRHP